ncbi:MAG: hypothetical protein ACLQHF_05875 [Terracidiphilus sp.]
MSKRIEHASGLAAKTGASKHRALRISKVAAWPNLAIRGGAIEKGQTQGEPNPADLR